MRLRPRILTNILATLVLLASPALKADGFSLHFGFDGYSRYPGYYCNYWPGSYGYGYSPWYYFPVFYGNHYPFYYMYYPTYYCPRYYYSRFYYPPVFQFYYSYYYPWYYYRWYGYPYYGHHHYRKHSHPPHRHHEQHRARLHNADRPKHPGYYSHYSGGNQTAVTTFRKPATSGSKPAGFATYAAGRSKTITPGNRNTNIQYKDKDGTPAVVARPSAPRYVKIINSNNKSTVRNVTTPRPGSVTTTRTFAAARPDGRNNVTSHNKPPPAGTYANTDRRRPSVSQYSPGMSMDNRQMPVRQSNKRYATATPRPARIMQQNRVTGMEKQISPRVAYGKRNNQQHAGQVRRGSTGTASGRIASVNQRQSPVMQQQRRAPGTESHSQRSHGKRNNQQHSGQSRRGGNTRP